MQSRRNAILLAVLFAIIPLMGWVADIIMALVTLRKGAREGAIVLVWVMLPSLLLALKGYPQFLLYNALAGSVITYVFALVLRHAMNWTSVIQAAVIIGVLEIIALHVVVPNIDADWSRGIINYFAMMQQQLALQAGDSDVRYWAELLGKIITGFQITLLFLYDLIILVLARYVQARLYNPTGLRQELYNIRLSIIPIAIFALAVIGALSGNEVALDCLFLTAMPFIVAGISLTHNMAAVAKISGYWFIGFYGLLILFFPYFALALAVFALADSGFNFRQRFKHQ
jgi:hypothetical protein